MFVGFLYLLAFLLGLFIVWKLGRDEYYDEEKLIDLVLFSTSLGLFAARFSFFVIPQNRAILQQIFKRPTVLEVTASLFSLSGGSIWWVGVFVFYLTAVILLRVWKWPLWPMLGILSLGGVAAVLLEELLLWSSRGPLLDGLVIVTASLVIALMLYVLRLGGARQISEFVAGFKTGWERWKS